MEQQMGTRGGARHQQASTKTVRTFFLQNFVNEICVRKKYVQFSNKILCTKKYVQFLKNFFPHTVLVHKNYRPFEIHSNVVVRSNCC